jgi:hypothetical protein
VKPEHQLPARRSVPTITNLLSLSSLLFLNTANRPSRRATSHLLQLIVSHLFGRHGSGAVDPLIKLDDGLRVDGLELGLVQVVAGGSAEAVGAAARVGHLVVVVFELGEADWTPGENRM